LVSKEAVWWLQKEETVWLLLRAAALSVPKGAAWLALKGDVRLLQKGAALSVPRGAASLALKELALPVLNAACGAPKDSAAAKARAVARVRARAERANTVARVAVAVAEREVVAVARKVAVAVVAKVDVERGNRAVVSIVVRDPGAGLTIPGSCIGSDHGIAC
jgi:hypothetical protein